MKTILLVSSLTLALVAGQSTDVRESTPTVAVPRDAAIRSILSQRVAALSGDADGIGIVVGVVDRDGSRIVAYGHRDRNDPRPLDGNTGFEIGSVGKIFTAMLLADMVRKGEVALSDPVARYLPDVKVPSRGGRLITLLDLATHTSALPFMPDQGTDPREFLAKYALPYEIGSRWEYSNLGYWLLGAALAARAKTDFKRLVQERVIAPLSLTGTGFDLSPMTTANLARGHDASLQPAVAASTIPGYSVMAAAGAGLFSTTNDLMRVLAAAMRDEASPLSDAIDLTVRTRRPVSPGGDQQALGWTIIGKGNDELVFRDGGTLGYASAVAFDPARRVGIVVLSNQFAPVADIARHLLRPEFPLERPAATRHTEIALDTKVLDSYVGRYEAAGEGVFTITRDGDHLIFAAPDEWGLPPLRIRPESATDFFASELPLRVKFQADDRGRVSGILVYPPRGQAAVPARRIGP